MNKKYQVFISSTYTDLVEERKKVQEILLMADCIPSGMEAFVATNDEQLKIIRDTIDLCDYYVLIIGGRYGSIDKDSGLSYTEMEYDYAVDHGIPVLVFAIDETIELDDKHKEKDTESIKRLKEFRSKALKNRLASIWKDTGDLAGRVAISIMKAKKEIERPGWIRGDEYDPEAANKANILKEENKRLLEEIEGLRKNIEETNDCSQLMFEEKMNIGYLETIHSGTGSYERRYNKEISLKEIFGKVSINMLNVSLLESALCNHIAKAIGADSMYHLIDKDMAKKICNQFIALGLMKSKWISEKNGLYYALTEKGIKEKDELNLFKKKQKD